MPSTAETPLAALLRDVDIATQLIDYFAALTTELRGSTIPMGEGIVNMTVREPFGVCAPHRSRYQSSLHVHRPQPSRPADRGRPTPSS